MGFALANEFSDHVTERGNYLWLAHSKLRPAALGAELLVGDLPEDLCGTSRILRDGRVLWEKPFLCGEANMSHSLANLEHHHFKYALFRRPGDVHVHFFGTATLSFADGVETPGGRRFRDFGAALYVAAAQSPRPAGAGAAAGAGDGIVKPMPMARAAECAAMRMCRRSPPATSSAGGGESLMRAPTACTFARSAR